MTTCLAYGRDMYMEKIAGNGKVNVTHTHFGADGGLDNIGRPGAVTGAG